MTPLPNRVHLNAGVLSDHTFGAGFGCLLSCRPVNLGVGHSPHVEAQFSYGIRMELDRATAVELARRLTESVNALPFLSDAVHDATAGGDT